jgi:hypothetical protein
MSNRSLVFWLGLIFVASISYIVYDKSRSSREPLIDTDYVAAEHQAPAPKPEPLAVTAIDLEKAFDENEVAAQMKYGAQPLLISGKLTAITLDADDDAMLHIDSGAFLALTATLPPAQTSHAAGLKKGDRVKILCAELREMLGKPMIRDCWLQD